MESSSRPPTDIRDLPRGQKRKLALIIGLCAAAGLGLAFSPPAVKKWGISILDVLLTTAGSIGCGANAVICRRSRKRLLGTLLGLVSIGLALLAIPAWTDLFQLIFGRP